MRASKLRMAAFLVATAALLGGCAGPASVPGAVGSRTSLTWDINPQDRSQLVSGELSAALTSPIQSWNPASASADQGIVFALSPLVPTYYEYDGRGQATMNANYLHSARPEVVTGADGVKRLVVTLDLNPKAVWNDGRMINASDWVATWKALNGSNPDFAVANSTGWDRVRSVTAGTSPLQVVITFSSTYPDWTGLVASGPMRAEGVANPDVFNKGWGVYQAKYFSGPFVVSRWDKTSGAIVMTPNPRWWGAQPLLSKITWKLLPPDALAAAFANQEIDYYDIGPDAAGYAQATKATNSEVRVGVDLSYRQMTFNSRSANLSDQRVRQAIVMGLNRTQIAQSDLAGLPGPKEPLNNNLYVQGQPGYVDEAVATGLDYHPERAKSLLDRAGWRMNPRTGFREKGGKQLDVTFVSFSEPVSKNEGLQAQQMLKQIGVNVVQKAVPANQYMDVITSGSFDLVSFTWSRSAYPLSGIGQIYGGTVSAGAFTPSPMNVAGLKIERVLQVESQLDTEMDPVRRNGLGNEAARAIWESAHTLPLYQRPAPVGVRVKLANIGSMGLARVPVWENVGYTK